MNVYDDENRDEFDLMNDQDVREALTPDGSAGTGVDIKATRKVFQISIEGEEEPVTLVLPLSWKRLRFTRAMSKGDIWAAFESIWPPVPVVDEETGEPELDIDGEPKTMDSPEMEQLADLDINEDEFRMILERLGETLMKRKRPTRGTSRS
jgi:hypothetical protein